MWERRLSKKELELVEVLKQGELTKNEARKKGYEITRLFLMKCHEHDVPIYESDDDFAHKKYGILK